MSQIDEDLLLKLRFSNRIITDTEFGRPPPSSSSVRTRIGVTGVLCSDRDPQKFYFIVRYDRGAEQILPLGVMRELHPQLLIDYLLSTSLEALS